MVIVSWSRNGYWGTRHHSQVPDSRKEKEVSAYILLRRLCRSFTQHFYVYLIGQNLITWSHLTAGWDERTSRSELVEYPGTSQLSARNQREPEPPRSLPYFSSFHPKCLFQRGEISPPLFAGSMVPAPKISPILFFQGPTGQADVEKEKIGGSEIVSLYPALLSYVHLSPSLWTSLF